MRLIVNLEANVVLSQENPAEVELENQRLRYQIDGFATEPTAWSLPLAVVEVPDSTGIDWKHGESVTVRLGGEELDRVPQLDGDRWVLLGLPDENLHLRSIDANNLVDHAKMGNYGFRVVEHYLGV
jgi:hypothetical protein